MNTSETTGRVVPIGEPDSAARRLALNRAVREGPALSMVPRLREAGRLIDAAAGEDEWLKGNRRTLRETARDLERLLTGLRKEPLAVAADGPLLGFPRIYEIAVALVEGQPAGLTPEAAEPFIADFQDIVPLSMGELWALDTVLRLAILEALGRASGEAVAALILSLKAVESASWLEFFEENSRVEKVLREDPAGAYARMDFATRDRYRHAVGKLARYSNNSEEAVARAAVDLANAAEQERERHVGFFLIDAGAGRLKAGLDYRPDWRTRCADLLLRWPTVFYLGGIELTTLALAVALLSLLPDHLGYLGLIVFLLATEPAIAFVNALVTYILPPHTLPKLDFSEGIPADCVTMTVVPTLLLSEKFVAKLLRDLEVRYLGNRDPRLCFALLTDFPDATNPTDELDHLAEQCAAGVRQLNERYGTQQVQPFFLFHRRREWNPKQATWMGLERKRGKLIALNNLLRGVEDAFHIKEGDLSVLPLVRFIITLDSDTELPRGAAQQLAGTLAHPLNQAVIDPATNVVREGYGILQPRVGISIDSARRSRLAALYSGQTGYDLYSTAVSDVYQDLFGEGSYVGKGIYDVDVFQQTLAQRFPHDLLLSHDLIEGTYARAGLVTDIELIDDYPSHYSAWSKRKHRWTRGDWQIMLWLLPRVPDYAGKLVPNPLSVISLWKIVDNLRRSTMEIAVFVLLLAGWLILPGGPAYWTLVVVIVTALPVYLAAAFSLLRVPLNENWRTHLADTWRGFVSGHVEAIFRLIFLPHQACLMLDAILRSIVRTTITGRRLLEWESAAQAEMGGAKGAKRTSTIERFLWLAVPISLLSAAAVVYVNPAGLKAALAFLAGWALSPWITLWLNATLTPRKDRLNEEDRVLLRDVAARTWNYFEEFATEDQNWLVPDNIREGDGFRARRISPTNLGLQLNAQLAALDFELISKETFRDYTARVFATMRRLERVHGHFLNWYSTENLEALTPRYVSTVDSGNLAASLIALKQGLLELNEPELAGEAGRWIDEMDFSFLLKPKRRLFHTGFNVETEQLDSYEYDLLASESRTASFIAIAKNDVPHTHWARLGRRVVNTAGRPALLSWSGTMFEYLMPNLWMRRYVDTLLDQAACGAVRCQQAFGRKLRLPWGVSECASAELAEGQDNRYFAFGIPELAANPEQKPVRIVAPYATLLALEVAPRAAIRNLQNMVARGWLGRHGLYESADHEASPETVVKMYMAHHHGMSLVALDNLLHGNIMQERFHREPMIESAALLLHERAARRAPEREREIVSGAASEVSDRARPAA